MGIVVNSRLSLALAMPECQSYRDLLAVTHCYRTILRSKLCMYKLTTRLLKGMIMSDPNAQAPGDPNLGQQPPQQPYQPPQPPYQPVPPVTAAPLTEAEDKQWASFAHLGGIVGFLPSLIIWLVFKDRGRFTATEAKEALNFQITLAIVYVISVLLWIALIGILTYFAAVILSIIFSVFGFMKAKDGQSYRYPFALRLIK